MQKRFLQFQIKLQITGNPDFTHQIGGLSLLVGVAYLVAVVTKYTLEQIKRPRCELHSKQDYTSPGTSHASNFSPIEFLNKTNEFATT